MLAWWACACLIAAVCDGTIEVFGHSSYAVLSEPIYARENNKTSRPYVEFSGTNQCCVLCGAWEQMMLQKDASVYYLWVHCI